LQNLTTRSCTLQPAFGGLGIGGYRGTSPKRNRPTLSYEQGTHVTSQTFRGLYGYLAHSSRLGGYRGTSLIRNCFLLGTCIRSMPRGLWLSSGMTRPPPFRTSPLARAPCTRSLGGCRGTSLTRNSPTAGRTLQYAYL
jgi:hypothetical protein